MHKRLAKMVLPLAVLAAIAALTIGVSGNCSALGDWVMKLV